MGFLDSFFLPDCEKFDNEITPNTAVDKLIEFNSHPGLIRLAKDKSTPKSRRNWLLNSFQYAAQKLRDKPEDMPRMAKYLNTSEIFNSVAPEFYDGTTWHYVLYNLIAFSNPKDRIPVVMELERNGHMQGCVREGHGNINIFYDLIVEGHTVEEAKRALRRSASFQIAKTKQHFIDNTLDSHRQFGDLL